MRNEADNESLLIQYLLGRLPEQEQLRIEEMFFKNDQFYERLLAIESELFYDYAQGKLSPGERDQFEKHVLTSGRNQRRAILASVLTQKMSEAAQVEMTKSTSAYRNPQSWRQSLKSFFGIQSSTGRLSLAAFAVVLLCSFWLVIEIVKLRNELGQFRANRTTQEALLQQQTQQERDRAAELSIQLNRERDENARLKQTLSKTEAQSDGQGQGLSAEISFVLAPTSVRSGANNLKRLHVPSGTRLLTLQLNLKDEVEYKSYQAILLTAEGVKRSSQDRLRAKRTNSGHAIFLRLPASLLAKGDYELRIKGVAINGTLEDTGDYYYFSILYH